MRVFIYALPFAACGFEQAPDENVGNITEALSHAPVSRLTASGSVTAVQGSPVAFPSDFQANFVIAVYDTDKDGIIDSVPGANAHTFPYSVATPFQAGKRIGSSLAVGTPPGPGFCGDILVYALDTSGPVSGETYFVWFALRSAGYQVSAGCDPSNVDAGAGAYTTSAVVHHETLIGGFANGSSISGFQYRYDLGAGTTAWPGRFTIDSISSVVVNQITGTFNSRITLGNVAVDVPFIHETQWDGISMFNASATPPPSLHPQVTLSMYANTFGADVEDYERVHFADITGDGRDDLCIVEEQQLVCAPMGTDRLFGVLRPVHEDFGWADLGAFPYWKTVQFPDLNGDKRADVCAYTRVGVRCALATTSGFAASRLWDTTMNELDGWTTSGRYNTIRFPDVNGDKKADLCGRNWNGIQCAIGDGTSSFYGMSPTGARFSDARGFNVENKWGTIRYADIDGNGRTDVCVRGADGIYCSRALPNGVFENDYRWHANFRDSYGWNADPYWRTIRLGDVNGDGSADLCGRGNAGVYCVVSLGGSFDTTMPLAVSAFSDGNGWNNAKYYNTIALADINGDGTADVCGRGIAGVYCAAISRIPYTRAYSAAPANLFLSAFGDGPHRTPGTAGVGGSQSWWGTLRPANIDTDTAREFCGITPWGAECSL